MKACGTVFKYGDNIDTDVIIPARYLNSSDPKELAQHCMEDAIHSTVKFAENVKDGDIILMHEIYPTTADAVKKMVPELIKQGYQLVTCEELIQAKTGEAPSSGTQYVNAKTINNKTK